MADDHDEAQHLLTLQTIKRRKLRVLETQIETYGETNAPTHLLVERAELRQALGVVESVLASPLDATLSDELGEGGRFVAFLEQLRRLERTVNKLVEDSMNWRERISLRIIILFVVVIVLAVSIVVLAVLLAFWVGRLGNGAAWPQWLAHVR